MLESESTPGHSAAGRIMSMKNFSDTIGNRTRHLRTCSAVHTSVYIYIKITHTNIYINV